MRHTLQFHTYPDGDALFMNKDEIVLRLTGRGSVNDCYAGDLLDGDQYCQRLQTKLQKRTSADILNFTGYVDDLDVIELRSSNGSPLVTYPNDNAMALREAVEFVMDQEEL
jgi:hypothetical protein